MLGQEVNDEKTSIVFSSNVTTSTKHTLIELSNFTVVSNLGKYLGVPISGKAFKRNDYQYIIKNISSELISWKANHLSFAGRVNLSKSVMEAMHIYPMMISMIPKACIEEIHGLQRSFI